MAQRYPPPSEETRRGSEVDPVVNLQHHKPKPNQDTQVKTSNKYHLSFIAKRENFPLYSPELKVTQVGDVFRDPSPLSLGIPWSTKAVLQLSSALFLKAICVSPAPLMSLWDMTGYELERDSGLSRPSRNHRGFSPSPFSPAGPSPQQCQPPTKVGLRTSASGWAALGPAS